MDKRTIVENDKVIWRGEETRVKKTGYLGFNDKRLWAVIESNGEDIAVPANALELVDFKVGDAVCVKMVIGGYSRELPGTVIGFNSTNTKIKVRIETPGREPYNKFVSHNFVWYGKEV